MPALSSASRGSNKRPRVDAVGRVAIFAFLVIKRATDHFPICLIGSDESAGSHENRVAGLHLFRESQGLHEKTN